MTLLEAPEFPGGAVESFPEVAPVPAVARAARRYRGVRNAGFARLEEFELRAMAIAAGSESRVALSRHLEALFSEARGILAEQLSELDHCLKQAYGARPALAAPPAQENFERLTGAERRVFAELAEGKPNKIIAFNLAISEATVKAHVSKILKKLKVHSRNRAIALFAARPAG
jgi:DNA-binding NarL/FixJ family response regulator